MISSVGSNSHYNTSLAQLSQQLFSMIDQDSDGSVTSTDLLSLTEDSNSSLVDSFMSKVDTNTDDAVTELEFASALAKLIQEMTSNSTNGVSADDMSAAGPPPPPPPKDEGEMFTSLDINSDGSLTVDELTAGGVPNAEKIFGEIDTDSDGKISQTESDAFDQKMKANDSQAGSADSSSSTNLSSLQTEFLGKLMEMIAQNQSSLDFITKTNSVVA